MDSPGNSRRNGSLSVGISAERHGVRAFGHTEAYTLNICRYV